jgi:hypothetical protein
MYLYQFLRLALWLNIFAHVEANASIVLPDVVVATSLAQAHQKHNYPLKNEGDSIVAFVFFTS